MKEQTIRSRKESEYEKWLLNVALSAVAVGQDKATVQEVIAKEIQRHVGLFERERHKEPVPGWHSCHSLH